MLLRNGECIQIREYNDQDFVAINQLNSDEQWSNLVAKKEDLKKAWDNSDIAFVVLLEEEIIGYIRGMADMYITLYVCELLVSKKYRGLGVGQYLLNYVHELYPSTRIEMLASSTSHTFYKQLGYRPFYGFRKTYGE